MSSKIQITPNTIKAGLNAKAANSKAAKRPVARRLGIQTEASKKSVEAVKKNKPKPISVMTPTGKIKKVYVPGSGTSDKPFRFAKGQSGNAKTCKGITNHSTKLLSTKKTMMLTVGMSPLEFLTLVYRDELYDAYDADMNNKHFKCTVFTPKTNAKKIAVTLEHRIAAANTAAPYIHRKRPIGIDGGEGKPISFVTADTLSKLTENELDALLTVMDKLGMNAEFDSGRVEDVPYTIENESAK